MRWLGLVSPLALLIFMAWAGLTGWPRRRRHDAGGGACMDLSELWADPEYRENHAAGRVDVRGRPLAEGAPDLFAKYHRRHE